MGCFGNRELWFRSKTETLRIWISESCSKSKTSILNFYKMIMWSMKCCGKFQRHHGKKPAEGPRVTITIITTYLANNLWTGSIIGGMIMLPAKLKTFHDDLMDGVHTLERGGFCFFIFKTVWKVWSGHFLLSIHNHIHWTLQCQAEAQVQTFCCFQ